MALFSIRQTWLAFSARRIRKPLTPARPFFLALAGVFLALHAGCVSSGPSWLTCWSCGKNQADDAAPPCVQQVITTWESRVVFDADIVNNGRPHPGLKGRVYLFGKEPGYPVVGKGELIVDLYDVGQRGPDGSPKMLERWHFDPESLAGRLQKDIIGWGYNLFLPWGTYRPEVTQVSLTTCFVPTGGQAIYAPATTLSLQTDRPVMTMSRQLPGMDRAGKTAPQTLPMPGKLGSPR